MSGATPRPHPPGGGLVAHQLVRRLQDAMQPHYSTPDRPTVPRPLTRMYPGTFRSIFFVVEEAMVVVAILIGVSVGVQFGFGFGLSIGFGTVAGEHRLAQDLASKRVCSLLADAHPGPKGFLVDNLITLLFLHRCLYSRGCR